MKQNYTLTTDILEQQFGPVKAKVIHQTEKKRLVCIYAVAKNKPLEYALVHFNQQTAQYYSTVHHAIIAGALMGKSFQAAGVAFERSELASFTFELPTDSKKVFGAVPGKAMVKYVVLKVGPKRTEYARNIELYAPDIIWPNRENDSDYKKMVADQLLTELLQNLAHYA